MTQSPPDAETLRKFALGDLPPAEWDRVARYLEANPQSPETLVEPAAEDTFVSALRAAPADAPADSPELQSIIDAAAKLVPDAATAVFDQSVSIPFEPTAEYAVPPKPGERLGRFRIERVLGRGGMGVVYAAADEQLDRRIALKVMAPQLAANPVAKDRFLREARAAARVEHDNIVPILEVGEDRGIPFMAMPLLRGRTLDERLGEGTPNLDEALAIARGTVDGLAAAHDRGLIHRDIKPSNLWLETNDDGSFRRVRLLDFGLARQEADADRVTKSGTILGTPAYMAPEQARGEAVDARADLFSLGCVLYRMVTGQNAFRGSDTYSLLTSLAIDRPKAPCELNADIPHSLSHLIMDLLEKDAKRRPASARVVRDRLAEVASAAPASAPRRGHAMPITAIALSLIGFVGAMFGGTIVRIATNKGELVVEIHDGENVEIVVKQNGAVVVDKTKDRRFVLTATDGEIEFLDPDTGVTTQTKTFRLTRGGVDRVVATMGAKPNAVAAKPVPDVAGDDREAARHILKRGNDSLIQIVGYADQQYKRAADLPDHAFEIHYASIRPFGDSDVPALRGLKRVEHLMLEDGVSDRSLAELARISLANSLQSLSLHNQRSAGLSDDGMKELARFPFLRHLTLARQQRLTERGLARLSAIPKLDRLTLSDVEFSDREFQAIQGVKLNILELHRCRNLTDDGFGFLKEATELIGLTIEDCKRVTDKGLVALPKLPSLQNLDIRGCSVTAEGVKAFVAARPACRVIWSGGVIEPTASPSPAPLTAEQRKNLEAILARGGYMSIPRAGLPTHHIQKGQALPAGAGAPESISIAMLDTDTPATILGILEQVPPGLKTLNMHYFPFTGADLEKLVAMPNLVKLESLSILSWNLRDDDLRHLRKLTKLKSVSVNFTPTITVAGIAHLKGLPLEVLSFQECPVDDSAIDTILSFRDLQQLGILNTKITAKGLARLPELTKLYNVAVGGPSATEAALQELARCQNIGEFSLINFPNAALPILVKFPKLQVLSLNWNTPPTHDALAAIAKCPRLRKVTFYGKPVTAEHARQLATLLPNAKITWDGGTILPKPAAEAEQAVALWVLARGDRVALAVGENIVHPKTAAELPKDGYSIAEVYLANAGDADLAALAPLWRALPPGRERTLQIAGPITNTGLGSLRGCAIHQLGLNRITVSDDGLPALAEIKGLMRLQLDATQVTDRGLAALAKCPSLVHVDLLNTPIGDAGLRTLAELPHLHSLTLTNTTATAAGLAALARRAKLQQLTLSGTVGKDAKNLGTPLGRMATLRTLNVVTNGFTDDDLKAMTAAPITLLRLGSTRLTDKALDHLAAMKSLETLHLEANAQLGAPAIQKLAAALPACRIHWSGGVIEPKPTGDAERAAALAVLAKGGKVRVNGEALDIADARDLPAKPFQLSRIDLSYRTELKDADFIVFDGCRHLRELDLRSTKPTPAWFAHFRQCAELEVLNLDYTGIGDAGLENFKNCKKLKVLRLARTKVTAAGLAHFGGCSDLTELALEGEAIIDAAVAPFKDCRKLKTLFLSHAAITDSGLANFAGCVELASLNLNHVKGVGDAGIRAISTAKLMDAELSGTGITDASLTRLAGNTILHSLKLSDTKVTNAGLAALKDLPALDDLALIHLPITDEGLAALQGKNFRVLQLGHTKITDAGIVHLKASTRLSNLELPGTKVTDKGLSNLRDLKELAVIELSGCDVSGSSLKDLNLNQLESLSMARTAFDDDGLASLAKLPKLRRVHCEGSKVTRAGIEKFHDAAPKCTIVWDRGTVEPK